MDKICDKPFRVILRFENNYYRLHVTHTNFTGRIRKRMGDRTLEESENIAFNIKFELGKHFANTDISKEAVEDFVEKYLSLNVTYKASIFEYSAIFLEKKFKGLNKKTKKPLSKSTIASYKTTIKYFEEYLKKNNIPPHPSYINSDVLDGYYSFIGGSHNYKVKLHDKLKGFIKFLIIDKRIKIDPGYKNSAFTEEYDNQFPGEDDIALPNDVVLKLIELRRKLLSGDIVIPPSEKSDIISEKIRKQQFQIKSENLIKCLDCYLLMISTGMYHADVMKSKLLFSNTGKSVHLKYRRSKNGSLCKTIPVQNDEFFIGQEIIKQYKIINNTNFPLNMSLTHFAKHLYRISDMIGLDFVLKNKMARKTFASELYFNRNMPIHLLQILLGHQNVKDTQHYLRINDNDLADEIHRIIKSNGR